MKPLPSHDHTFRGALLDVVENSEAVAAVGDLGIVGQRVFEWRRRLPNIKCYYAIKCNADAVVLGLLAALGVGFDCASRAEIKMALVAGVVGDVKEGILFANPCKMMDDLEYAKSIGVRVMTFDSKEELGKVKEAYSRKGVDGHHEKDEVEIEAGECAQLLLRIAVDDRKALCPLSTKFGARMVEVKGLLEEAKHLQLDVVGVAFHVGSGCNSLDAYLNALEMAKKVFDLCETLGLSRMTVLDIGGGFPSCDGESGITFSMIASAVRKKIDLLFEPSVRVIAEPGRYLVGAAFAVAAQVLSRKVLNDRANYIIGDGVYGSFKDAIILGLSFKPHRLIAVDGLAKEDSETDHLCSVYGPTCDANDIVCKNAKIVGNPIDVGDWMWFDKMGAYTFSLSSTFNGFLMPDMSYYSSL